VNLVQQVQEGVGVVIHLPRTLPQTMPAEEDPVPHLAVGNMKGTGLQTREAAQADRIQATPVQVRPQAMTLEPRETMSAPGTRSFDA
jgi:hypothetical protein